MRVRDEEELAEPEFSMAPMLDVVFQLLIFFMLATNFSKAEEEREIEVDLPSTRSAAPPEPAPEELVINVLRDGRYGLAGRALARGELEEELLRAARSHADVPVTIRGDRLVHHEDVVAVLDACGLAGLSNVAVGTLEAR